MQSKWISNIFHRVYGLVLLRLNGSIFQNIFHILCGLVLVKLKGSIKADTTFFQKKSFRKKYNKNNKCQVWIIYMGVEYNIFMKI